MRTLPAIGAIGLLTMSCTVLPSFVNMNDEELLAYNRGRPVMEQVYCTKEARTSSRIRKTYCDTVSGWINYNTRSILTINTLSTSDYSVLRRSPD